METSFLRPLLQSLCCNSPWNYAVFWKLEHQNEMALVWEDGFCDNLKLRDPMVSPIQDLYLENSNKILSSNSRSSALDGTPGEYPVGLAVAEMSSGSHVVGTGVVGKAAFTGNASWIYSDNIATNAFNSVLVPEYPDEWLLQFAAGIKTILLLPVIPHGVLQLGSVEMVAEDAALLAYVKDKFEAHMKPDGYDLGCSTQQFSMMSTFLENLEEPSTITTEELLEDQNAIHAVTTCVADTLENLTEIDFSQQPLPRFNLADPCQLSYDISNIYHEETLSPSSYFDIFSTRIYEELMNESTDFHFEVGATAPTFPGNDFDSTFGEWDFELHRILGTSVEDNPFPYTYASSISGMDVSGVESVGFPMEEMQMERLLEAVVANASSITDDNSSNKSGITSSNVSLGEKYDESEHSVSVEEYKVPCNFLTSEFIAPGINATRNLCDKQQKRKGFDSVNPGKLSRLPTTNKRRARTGDNLKPKPRDRQLIQDRLKELRELVPNSEKCSIDGLLDKTIKHMLFLRNVTKQAEKLRHHKEEADEKTRRPAEVNYSSQKGTSWAVELGSEQQMCPIVVKDLDHPKHMLIEMLCTDYDRFLEIGDVMHRLQLTILEGVMEKSAGDNSSWARFIVEGTGSFHRLDIFWPLMQLVQQSRAPISSKI